MSNFSSESGTLSSFTPTPEQCKFIGYKKKVAEFKAKKSYRKLTRKEQKAYEKLINEGRYRLWQLVERFAMKTAYDRMRKYALPSDAYTEVKAMMTCIFFEKLPYYDPVRSAPTTYFKKYFDQEISEYVLKFSQHMTQYDANNVAKVRAAQYYYESRNIKYDEAMLVTKTGLSPTVVKKTLKKASNSIMADVDEMRHLSSMIPTPDAALYEKERASDIIQEIKKRLTPDEIELFITKANVDGKRPLPSQKVADILNSRHPEMKMTAADVKKKWNAVITELEMSPVLRAYNKLSANIREHVDTAVHLNAASTPMSNMSLDESFDLFNADFHVDL